jgi:hypothetical protein
MATIVSSEAIVHHRADDEGEESEEEPFVPAPLSWFEPEDNDDDDDVEDPVLTSHSHSSVGTSTRGVGGFSAPSRAGPRNHMPPPQSSAAIGAPLPSPSWKEISSQVLPSAAKELLSSSLHRILYTARLTYARGRWSRKYSELGNNTGGYYRTNSSTSDLPPHFPELPPFSSLKWVDRQLVKEWRTYELPIDDDDEHDHDSENEEVDFDRARTLVPKPIQRPVWQKAEVCLDCHKLFGPTRLRHHCRLCGYSFCQSHSSYTHRLPHLGYDPQVPERVCDTCKTMLLEQNLAERVAWRLARCRDYQQGADLTPYFETGVDTVEEVALRITHAALAMAKSIPLGAQAHVAVETVDVLRKHGLNGIYTIMLRQEFLAAADLLRKALGINRTAWPLSVHELSAAIFYALAQHRAMRGMNPEREQLIHSFRESSLGVDNDTNGYDTNDTSARGIGDLERVVEEARIYSNSGAVSVANLVSVPGAAVTGDVHKEDASVSMTEAQDESSLPFTPVCDPVSNSVLASLIFYAPMALTFIYATKEVDMQLLAAQQGWRLLYASLEQEGGRRGCKVSDRPASALFVHEEHKIACVAVRGTTTIHDVITDIRQMPVPFPESDSENTSRAQTEEDWTTVGRGKGLAVCGMATAANNLYREHIDSLLSLSKQGYRIRMTGHSLGGGVATLLGVLVLRDLNRENNQASTLEESKEPFIDPKKESPVRVYTYGTPSCVDATFADFVEPIVTSVVLHDDVIPRLTPSSCRGLLKHLLHIRETWVKDHFNDDIMAITERAKTAWAPRWRGSFTLPSPSSSSIKRYCRKQIQYGKKQIQYGKRQLRSVKEKLAGDTDACEEQGLQGNDDQFDLDEPAESLATEDLSDGFEVASGCDASTEIFAGAESSEPRLLMDIMGGLDSRSEGVVIDGDEFFETDESLVESDDSVESLALSDQCDDAADSRVHEKLLEDDDELEAKVNVFEHVSDGDVGINKTPESLDKSESVDDEGPGVVILEETPLPRMYIPGRIVHIYSHRGVYRAAHVPRGFRELRRISLAGNMLLDHTCKAYYEALLETHTVRVAGETPPRWTAFDEDDTWYVNVKQLSNVSNTERTNKFVCRPVCSSCCASRFTWASTSDSEAQEARDKHNCRSCGTLVCDPCSKNRIPLPSIGLTVPTRVCDRCYNDLDGLITSPSPKGLASSFVAEDCRPANFLPSKTVAVGAPGGVEDKPERKRDRRSAVVDELASRVRAKPLACP